MAWRPASRLANGRSRIACSQTGIAHASKAAGERTLREDPMSRRLVFVTAIVVLLLLPITVPGRSAALDRNSPTITTVMTGLLNPRGLAFDRDGALYVVEAGRGGSGPCIQEGTVCYGDTGGV